MPTGSNHDFVSVSGNLQLGTSTGGTDARVAVSFSSYATANYGDVFNLLDWTTLSGNKDAGTLSSMGSGNFSAASNLVADSFTGALSGLAFDTSLFNNFGILVVVPEPSRALFLMLGLLGLMLRRRRRSSSL